MPIVHDPNTGKFSSSGGSSKGGSGSSGRGKRYAGATTTNASAARKFSSKLEAAAHIKAGGFEGSVTKAPHSRSFIIGAGMTKAPATPFQKSTGYQSNWLT